MPKEFGYTYDNDDLTVFKVFNPNLNLCTSIIISTDGDIIDYRVYAKTQAQFTWQKTFNTAIITRSMTPVDFAFFTMCKAVYNTGLSSIAYRNGKDMYFISCEGLDPRKYFGI